jgi:hypothetical protein
MFLFDLSIFYLNVRLYIPFVVFSLSQIEKKCFHFFNSIIFSISIDDFWSQSYQTFFFVNQRFFSFFAIKLGCFIVKALFSYVTNTQALHQKLENKEKTISSFFLFLFLSLAILKYRQYFFMLLTLKLNSKKTVKIFILGRKKFGRIDSRSFLSLFPTQQISSEKREGSLFV